MDIPRSASEGREAWCLGDLVSGILFSGLTLASTRGRETMSNFRFRCSPFPDVMFLFSLWDFWVLRVSSVVL